MPVTDLADLKRKVRLILSQVQPPMVSVYEINDDTAQALINARDRPPSFAPLPPGIAKVVNEQIPLLRLLHSESTPELRDQFVGILLDQIADTTAYVVVHIVLDIGGLEDIRRFLNGLNGRYSLRNSVWNSLLDRLIMEPHRFSDSDLDLLATVVFEENKRTEGFLKLRQARGGMRVEP